MKRLLILTLAIIEFSFISCRSQNKGNCDLPVNDLTIAKIIEKIIIEDTLTVSQDLFNMYAQKTYLKHDRIGLPGSEIYINMKLEKLRFYNVRSAYKTIRKLYPYLSIEDSLYIRCQINSDSTSKMIKRNLLSLKDLNEIDNYIFESLSIENRYREYPAFYTFSKPYFFNNEKLCFVDVRWHCGIACGDYWLILLAYRHGEWTISNRLRYGGL